MEGYVYIARIIDHGGKFVNGYHKIGLSKQYKVRETQLNSTHLPFDVLMIRVFETEDMDKLEGILHVCFDDYRVIKEYDDRRNITTEWFNVSDIDSFNDRVDKMVNYLDIKEVDLGFTVDNDTTLTEEEKTEVKNKIGRAKSISMVLSMDGVEYTEGTQKDLFIIACRNILSKVGKEKFLLNASFARGNKDGFIGYRHYLNEDTVYTTSAIEEIDGIYIHTYHSAEWKGKFVDKLCRSLGISGVKLEIV